MNPWVFLFVLLFIIIVIALVALIVVYINSSEASKIGGIKQHCPCDSDQNLECKNNICLGSVGYLCFNNNECASNYCNDGICMGGKKGGERCIKDAECQPGSGCSSGFCQENGRATGELGSVCGEDGGEPQCRNPYTCINGYCSNQVSECGAECNNNCKSPLFCIYESCLYSEEPNRCLASCIDGFQCRNSICLGETGSSCNQDSDCLNSCGGGGRIYYWNKNSWRLFSVLPFGIVFETIVVGAGNDLWASAISGIYYFSSRKSIWEKKIEPTIVVGFYTYTIVPSTLASSKKGTPFIVFAQNNGKQILYKIEKKSKTIWGTAKEEDAPKPEIRLTVVKITVPPNVVSMSILFDVFLFSTSKKELFLSNDLDNVLKYGEDGKLFEIPGIESTLFTYLENGVLKANNKINPLVNSTIFDTIEKYNFFENPFEDLIVIGKKDGIFNIFRSKGKKQSKIPGKVNNFSVVVITRNIVLLQTNKSCN